MTGRGTRTGQDLTLALRRWCTAEAVTVIGDAAKSQRWQYVVTPNAAHFARLQSGNPELAAIYRNADFCFLDSRVIALLARLAGIDAPPVVTGADLVRDLFARVITPTSTVCVVGGMAEAVARLRSRFGLTAIHRFCPPMGFWRSETELDRAAAFVADCGADFSFLCVGSPQQEILADRVSRIGGARGVGICAGASVDFLVGSRTRAPRAVQRLALEWAWRLAAEPRRLAYRYLVESPSGIVFALSPGGGLR